MVDVAFLVVTPIRPGKFFLIIISDIGLCLKCLVLWRCVADGIEKKDSEGSRVARIDGESSVAQNERENPNNDRENPTKARLLEAITVTEQQLAAIEILIDKPPPQEQLTEIETSKQRPIRRVSIPDSKTSTMPSKAYMAMSDYDVHRNSSSEDEEPNWQDGISLISRPKSHPDNISDINSKLDIISDIKSWPESIMDISSPNVGSSSNGNSNSNADSSDDKKSQGSDSEISGPKSVQDLNSLIIAAKLGKDDSSSISCGFVNSNSNEDSSDEKILEDIEGPHSGPKPLPDMKPEVSAPAPPMPTVRPAEEYSLRKYKDFPVNEQILDYMNETIIVIDHSFQNLFNNARSVYARSPSASIGRLLNIRIGSNPVTSAENYFNNPRRISLMCDYECAHKLTVIYK